ncbi:hypothetical protein PE36_18855 [Moritella sp. PE36]|nr:hypothetical protein PE36_18855 [Moritella sp. PE36]
MGVIFTKLESFRLSYEIDLIDFEKDIIPFVFSGFWNEGHCFLRIKVKDGKVVFLCAQLPNYSGTSITNAIESVFEFAVNEIVESSAIRIREKLSFWERIFNKKDTLEKKKKHAVFEHVKSKSILIEHYPPGTGINDNGSYARVVFSPSGEPTWNYTTEEKLKNLLNNEMLLEIGDKELENWKSKENC